MPSSMGKCIFRSFVSSSILCSMYSISSRIEPAVHGSASLDHNLRGVFRLANVHRPGTSGVKRTALRKIDQIGRLTRNGGKLCPVFFVQAGYRVNQALGVGVFRVGEKILRR